MFVASLAFSLVFTSQHSAFQVDFSIISSRLLVLLDAIWGMISEEALKMMQTAIDAVSPATNSSQDPTP